MILSWMNINLNKLNWEFTWDNVLLNFVFNIELLQFLAKFQTSWSKLKYLNLDQLVLL